MKCHLSIGKVILLCRQIKEKLKRELESSQFLSLTLFKNLQYERSRSDSLLVSCHRKLKVMMITWPMGDWWNNGWVVNLLFQYIIFKFLNIHIYKKISLFNLLYIFSFQNPNIVRGNRVLYVKSLIYPLASNICREITLKIFFIG